MKIGLISAASYGYMGAARTPGSNHGTAFATTLNGWDETAAKQCEGVFIRSQRRLAEARVTRIWDPNQEAANRLAAACSIEKVCPTPEEVCLGVDAVILIDDGTGEQWRHARYPLSLGLPVFCDKPLAMRAKDAREVAAYARARGARLMSSSSLRFVPDVVRLREDLPKLGGVHLATVACGNELIYYGIHALSMAYALFGGGAVSAINVGQPGLNQARIRFADHRDVVLLVGEPTWMSAGYQINLYGRRGWRSLQPDLNHLYSYLLEAFLNYVKTGVEPYPIEQEVELIGALEAAKHSLQLGREVMLSEVLET